MNKKKIVTLVVIIIILIIAIAIGGWTYRNIARNYTIEQIGTFKYYTIEQNGKFGVIDASGTTIIEPTYEAIKVPNPTKPVFICIYEYNTETGDYQAKVLNDKAEEIFTEYEEVNAIQLKEIVSTIPYEKSVLRVKKNGKYGLINFEGKVIVEPMYDELDNIAYKEGELLVKKNDKYGVINIKGNKLIDLKYDTITGDNYYSNTEQYKTGGYIVGNKTEEGYRYAYINSKGKMVLKMEYNKIYRMTEIQEDKTIYLVAEKSGQAGLYKNKKQLIKNEYQSIEYDELNKVFTVENNKKFGVMDLEGNQIIPVEYDSIVIEGIYIYASKGNENTVFDMQGTKQDNLKYKTVIEVKDKQYHITIDDNDRYGLEDHDGNVLIPNEYLYMEYAYGEYFIACAQDGKLGVISAHNEKKTDIKYDVVQKLDNTDMIQATLLQNSTIELYNSQMQKIASMDNAVLTTKEQFIKLYSDKEVKYYTMEGIEKKNTEIFPDNVLFSAQKDGKWGFVDKDGNTKVDYQYDKVTEFNPYGFAGIKQDNKWGVIDRNGTVVQEPIYTLDDKFGEPEFIGKYYQVLSGYGEIYYTDAVKTEWQE